MSESHLFDNFSNFQHGDYKKQKESGISSGLQALEAKPMDSGESRPCSITEEVSIVTVRNI